MKMTEIKTAIRERLPFEIITLAGDKFVVTESDQIAIASKRKAVIVVGNDEESIHIVPLVSMSTIAYLPKKP
jgi:hypothetical protein